MITVSLDNLYGSISEYEQSTTRATKSRYAEDIEDEPIYFTEPANYSVWTGHRTAQFKIQK